MRFGALKSLLGRLPAITDRSGGQGFLAMFRTIFTGPETALLQLIVLAPLVFACIASAIVGLRTAVSATPAEIVAARFPKGWENQIAPVPLPPARRLPSTQPVPGPGGANTS